MKTEEQIKEKIAELKQLRESNKHDKYFSHKYGAKIDALEWVLIDVHAQ